jgi:hypothetical protein
VDPVRRFLDPVTAGTARNDCFEAPNTEGISMPTLTRAAIA